MTDQRFTLSVAYFAGQRDEITKGADGFRDYFSADELERAAHAYLAKSPEVGLFHLDGTEGHGEVVESYIYRGPDWQIGDVLVKSGDWLLGIVWDEPSWTLIKNGKARGMSPQGRARRRAA